SFHLLLTLLLALYLLAYLFQNGENILESWLAQLLLVLLLAEALELAHQAVKRKVKRPQLTAKAILVMAMTFFVQVSLLYLYLFEFLDGYNLTQLALGLGILSLLEHDLSAAVILTLFEPVSRWVKRRMYLKARDKRLQHPNLIVIGITGSFGKTSVKEFVSHLLAEDFEVLKTDQHTNTEIGIAQTILRYLEPKHQIFVCEMGAYRRGEIKICCQIVRPKIGVFTGLNEQHLALFGSVDQTFQAKWELIGALPPEGTAIINGDCQQLKDRIKPFRGKSLVLSTQNNDDLKDIVIDQDGIAFTYKGQVFSCPLIGAFQVINVLMAISVAETLGMSLPRLAERVKTLRQPDKTMVLQPFKRGFIIDDSYNVNPDGLRGALDHVSTFEDHKKILVFPGILELGEESEQLHEQLGEQIGREVDYAFFTDSNFSEVLSRGALRGGMTRQHVFSVSDQEEVLTGIHQLLEKHPEAQFVVLFESRGVEATHSKLLKS
ncbi:MAG: UDP-N-acetylmuramoyl-tripeptide--D-alanyl-D-alanine ligase, partial [bacterium]|nr:UDP-N-acetylmuramoyl-tripeptide--D-alanyl-D-alanine ligase [bacterium]